MPKTQHTTSYYAASANPSPDRPALQASIEADVCVIGGGFGGISSALHLAEKGFKVVVLEGARIGWGASGRNGGQMVNSYSRDIDFIERTYGSDSARALGQMMFEGGDIIRQRIEKYAIQCDYKPGGVFVACNERQVRELEHQKALWNRWGNDQLSLHDRDATRVLVNSERYHGSMLDMRSGHIHPLNLVLGQAAAIESLGGVIYEDSKVTEVVRGSTLTIKTATGQVRAKFAVVAGNAYLGNLIPELAVKAMPCGTQMITTEPLGEARAKSLIPNDYCIEDCNYILDYFRLTGDHRLIYGGGVNYGGGDPASIENFVRPKLLKTFPQLAGVKIDYAWGGDFLLTLTRIPQLGRLGDNIYYAQGYSGHGVNTTHLAGKLIAEALTAQAERFDAFARLPHYFFPGGHLFRVPFTALGAWYYSLRDKLGI